jgi:hypothetical protein
MLLARGDDWYRTLPAITRLNHQGPDDWVRAELGMSAVFIALDQARLAFFTTLPTTIAGFAATLQFLAEYDFDEEACGDTILAGR